MKLNKLALTLLCMWNYAQAAIKMELINDDISDVFDSCDYTRFDNQLIKLQLGHDILQQNMSNMQKNVDRQMEILSDLQRKVNSLPQQIESMQEKLLQNNRINTEDLKRYISKEIQMQTAIVPPVDDKVILITDMKETLHEHDQILNEVRRKQDEAQALLKEINLDKHTQSLTKTISDKLAIVPQVDAKLSQIESNVMPKTVQLQFHHDIQQFFNRKDATIICLKDDNQNLMCNVNPTSCVNYDATICADNKCPIINDLYGRKPFLVACNNSVEGGGWTVIQRRLNGSVDFYRNWSDYKTGFGEIDGEFFIGLDKLHALTSTLKPVELLIQLDINGTIKYAKYDDFLVGNETENYKLKKVGSYTGNAGDSFSAHEGFEFTTKDRDNDKFDKNCAITCVGAWWYDHCYYSDLNGRYNIGILWFGISRNISLNFVEMLIRPKEL